jgi:uncharacterized lipoprotein YajG
MNLKSFKVTVSAMLLLLGTTLFLAGCQSTLSTQTAATDLTIATEVCGVWKPVTYSSRDTAETVTEVRANNASQKAYCKGTGK